MSFSDTTLSRRSALALLSSATVTALGCTLLEPFDLGQTTTTQRPTLPPIKPAVDAIQLQLLFVERPPDDPLVRDLLWLELDEVGAIPPATRQVLGDNGLRLGQSGSHPPPALQKLLGLTSEIVNDADPSQPLMRGRRVGLRSGQETEVQTVDDLRDCRLTYHLAGKSEQVDYVQSRSILKITPVRVQEGWIRLEFSPELHHGESRMRHTPTEEGWTLKGGQRADVRQAFKFQVMLNQGEMAVVTTRGEPVDSLGARMFLQELDGRGSQRLLVVRLADAGQSAETSALS